jgi:PAS domain-containing protein
MRAVAVSFQATPLAGIVIATPAMNDGVIVCDANGSAIRANPAAIAALSFDPVNMDPAGAAQMLSIHHSDGRLVAADEMPPSRALRGETVQSERFVLARAQERDMATLVSASPLFTGGQVSGAVIVWHDVT